MLAGGQPWGLMLLSIWKVKWGCRRQGVARDAGEPGMLGSGVGGLEGVRGAEEASQKV